MSSAVEAETQFGAMAATTCSSLASARFCMQSSSRISPSRGSLNCGCQDDLRVDVTRAAGYQLRLDGLQCRAKICKRRQAGLVEAILPGKTIQKEGVDQHTIGRSPPFRLTIAVGVGTLEVEIDRTVGVVEQLVQEDLADRRILAAGAAEIAIEKLGQASAKDD